MKIATGLTEDFETIVLLANSSCATRGVDSLLLAWVKHEKQLRKLFCFMVYQHPKISAAQISTVVNAIAGNRNLYPETFISAIEILSGVEIKNLLGEDYAHLSEARARIKTYRNKLAHGQITGLNLSTKDLLRDVEFLGCWMAALASSCQSKFGYDGMRRDSFMQAKKAAPLAVSNYPFASGSEFKAWVSALR